MVKKLFWLIKRFIVSVLLIYTYNIIVFSLGITIPINLYTILFVCLFGFPGVLGLCLLFLFVF